MRFLLLLISATVAFGTVSGQSTSTCGPVKPSPVANCDKVDYGSCGNACCTVDVSVADKPTDAYAKIKKYLEMGGSDGSFSYSAGPNRAGLNPGDDLTPYNISWKYIFQGSHVTTKGYVDHINMNIKVDGTTVDPSATTGHNAQCNTDPNNACGNELPQKECLAAGCCWEESADWACWHPAPPASSSFYWSSGVVASNSTTSLVLPSVATNGFIADASYKWRVRVGDPMHAATWSETATFDVAPTAAQLAGSSWIGGGSEMQTDFMIPSGVSVVRARAYASGLGAFELHVNGEKVGDHIMDPGEAVYDQKALYVGFNITEMLQQSRGTTATATAANAGNVTHAIGARIGNSKWGWLDIYSNRSELGDQSGDSSRAFFLYLTAQLADGRVMTLRTSAGAQSSWMIRHGPIVYDHLWHGEIYDARQELAAPTWTTAPLASYAAAAGWTSAKAMSPKVGALFPQLMPPIRVIADHAAVSTIQQTSWNGTAASAMRYDFGQNMAGYATLEFTKPPAMTTTTGDVDGYEDATTIMVRLRHSEIRGAPDGIHDNNFYPGMEFNHASATCSMVDWYARTWYECANQTDAVVFTTAKPLLKFTPTFTYHGFRFIELVATEIAADGTEHPLSPALAASFPWGAKITAHRVNSDLQPLTKVNFGTGGSSTSSTRSTRSEDASMITRIYDATMAAHVSQLWGIPTDCPQREKRGWMGDAGITSVSLGMFFDSFAFHTNFLRLIRDNQVKGCWNQPNTTIYGACTTKEPMGAAKWFNGSVPDVTPFPTGPYGGNPGSTDWQVAYVCVAWTQLHHHGAAVAGPMLADLWASLDLFMDYLERLVDPVTGLLLTGARGDWIPPEGNMKGPWPTPPKPIAAFFHTLCVSHMADIANAIGRADDAKRYTTRLAKNQAAYHKMFYNGKADKGAKNDEVMMTNGGLQRCCYDTGSQTNNVMALVIGAVPTPTLIKATVGMLVASIKDRNATLPSRLDAPLAADVRNTSTALSKNDEWGWTPPPWGAGLHIDVGIFGTTWIFETLRKYEQDAVGLAVLTETSYPSLGRMIVQNATTLWEAWDGDVHNIGKLGTSRNHIMFGGGVARFIAATTGGLTIDPRSVSGWRELVVAPSPAAMRMMRSGGMERRTPQGEASVAWRYVSGKKKEESVQMDFVVPVGATAKVSVPLLHFAADASITIKMMTTTTKEEEVLEECEIRCASDELTLAEQCGAFFADAVCRARLDGERVMSLTVGSGAYALRASYLR